MLPVVNLRLLGVLCLAVCSSLKQNFSLYRSPLVSTHPLLCVHFSSDLRKYKDRVKAGWGRQLPPMPPPRSGDANCGYETVFLRSWRDCILVWVLTGEWSGRDMASHLFSQLITVTTVGYKQHVYVWEVYSERRPPHYVHADRATRLCSMQWSE